MIQMMMDLCLLLTASTFGIVDNEVLLSAQLGNDKAFNLENIIQFHWPGIYCHKYCLINILFRCQINEMSYKPEPR